MEDPPKRIKRGLQEIYQREVGLYRPRNFTRRLSASEVILKRISLYSKLIGHDGCVNAVEFNSTGDLLVSGSDDRQVVIWDWATRSKKLTYSSGHTNNVFQTKIMPFTDDRSIITSSADGQVRLGQLLEGGSVSNIILGKHEGSVYKLAVEPGSPHIFYSCGTDGFVQHFDLRSSSATKLFYCSAVDKQLQKIIRLNDISIDPRNPNYFVIGGSDEYARVYDIRKCQWNMQTNSDVPVNLFCPRHLIGNSDVYITGLAYSNKSELLVSYNDELIYLFQKDMGIGPTPFCPSTEEVQKLEDPQVYPGHRNALTLKGVGFFGPSDEYVTSGSDCGHLFIWKKRDAKLVRVMRGDRHVVNHIEPHPHLPMFASCGIEKTIKLWAPMAGDIPPLPDNIEMVVASNREGREHDSQVTLTPDVVMHVLRLQRRQTLAYAERRHDSSADIASNVDEMEAYILGLLDSNTSAEEGSSGNSGDCNIS